MATTIAETTSRIRNTVKAVKEDPFLTDRFIYTLVIKYAKTLIRRAEGTNQLSKFSNLYRTIPCMELLEVDRIEACCGGVSSNCLIKRTKNKIPGVMIARFGPLLRTVSSIDSSIEVFPTTPSTYTSMTKTSSFKYNKRKYYWFINEYLYFPDMEWESIMIDGIFEDNITSLTCPTGSGDPVCSQRQTQETPIPDFLFTEIEQMVIKDLIGAMQIPEQPNSDDKMSPLR